MDTHTLKTETAKETKAEKDIKQRQMEEAEQTAVTRNYPQISLGSRFLQF